MVSPNPSANLQPPLQPNLLPNRLRRLGPRPLPLHLNLSLASWLSSVPGLMLLQINSPLWQLSANPPPPELRALAKQLGQQNPSELGPALARAVAAKSAALLAGIERYHQHPYQRQMKEPPAIWQEGSTRLLDYGGKGPVALVIPSLINKAYILDLDKQRSLMRWLAAHGLHPLLLDWGAPGSLERDYTLDDYVSRAGRALATLKQPVNLVGYCMGGLLALKLAAQHSSAIRKLALLATPWDFHAGNKAAALRTAKLFQLWQPGCQVMNELPIDLIQTLFTLLDPLGPQTKFTRFAEMTDPQDIESFVALEDWLNDGIPLTYKVAEQCLLSFYERNEAHLFTDPRTLRLPTLVMIPEQDRIVPPQSADALAALLPDCRRMKVPLGHIGMIVSRGAHNMVHIPLAEWLR